MKDLADLIRTVVMGQILAFFVLVGMLISKIRENSGMHSILHKKPLCSNNLIALSYFLLVIYVFCITYSSLGEPVSYRSPFATCIMWLAIIGLFTKIREGNR